MPQATVLRLANQLAVYPGMLEQYGRRAQTRSDHLKLVLKYLDWKPVPTRGETLKELEQFLLDRAMEHDSPSLLFHQAAEFLISARMVRPGVVTLMEMVATARTGAGALTSERVDHLLARPMRADLDRLLVHDPEIGATRLAWLTTPAVEATPASIKLAIDKLMYLRALDAHLLDLSMLPRRCPCRGRCGRAPHSRPGPAVQGLRRRNAAKVRRLLASCGYRATLPSPLRRCVFRRYMPASSGT
uniref:Transposase n=1 Tax=Nonomuraea gerenzanensis TaxID=93944 RepID=A0A1M4EJ16_9ACTN|nr:Transposase [Nonomuraea gerenzanensis]